LRAAPDGGRLAVVGLGAGALAASTRAGQRLDVFEIDPVVIDLAHRWFPYLDGAPAAVTVIPGDARLRLTEAAPAAYDLLLLDAFSSDAIPLHLLSAEAIDLYLDKLAPGGALAAHISNRHLDLAPVFRGHAARRGLAMAWCDFRPSPDAVAEGARRSLAVALARDDAALAPLRAAGCWGEMPPGEALDWTDQRASVLGVLGGR
jgi:spermidine synthase